MDENALRRRGHRPEDTPLLLEPENDKIYRGKKSVSCASTLCCLSPVIFWALVLFAVWLSGTFKPQKFILPPNQLSLSGPLEKNHLLRKCVHLLDHEVDGPIALLAEGGDVLFVATAGGKIQRTVKGTIVEWIKVTPGKDAKDVTDEPTTGRLTSISRLNNELLIVTDAYYGIFTVNFHSHHVEHVVPMNTRVPGQPLRYLRDLVVINEEEVIVTEVSTKWSHVNRHYIRMEHEPNGRLLKVNLRRKSIDVLLDGLYEPTGVQVLDDKDTLLIAETGIGRVFKYKMSNRHLTLWSDNLPGLPSGLRLSFDRQHLWIAFDVTRVIDANPAVSERLSEWPFVRKLLLTFIPTSWWTKYEHNFVAKHAMAVKYTQSGEAVQSLQAPGGYAGQGSVATVVEDDWFIFVGALQANFVGRLAKNEI